MRLQELLSNEKNKKIILVTILAAIALLSFFVISKPAMNPENYKATIASIDEKKTTVMGVSAAAATASTVLAAVPGDVTTPIANQILDISAYLMIVVCVLVLEKTLLTVMGFLSFKILVPTACCLFGAYIFNQKKNLKILATKFLVFALVIVTIIPVGVRISNFVYETNKIDIEQLTAEIDQNLVEDENTDNQSWLDKIIDKVTTGITNANEKAKQLLNNFIDAVALFIIAYCVLPVIIVLLVIWFIKFLFGISMPVTRSSEFPSFKKKKASEDESQSAPQTK